MSTSQVQPGKVTLQPVRYQPLVLVLAALVVGIILDRTCAVGMLAWVFVLLGGIALWPMAWRWRYEKASLLVLLIAAVALGGLWGHLRWRYFPADNASLALDGYTTPACIDVVATGTPVLLPQEPPDPMRTYTRQRMTRVPVRAIGIRDDTRWRSASGAGNLMVIGPLDGVRAGDCVRVYGYLQKAAPPGNPGEFDYGAFTRADRRLFFVRADSAAAVEILPDHGAGLHPVTLLARMREYFTGVLMRRISPERSGLAAAVLLGSRDYLDSGRRQKWFEVGAIHLLVVSGLHIAILVLIPFTAMKLGWLPRRSTLVAIIVIVILYALLTEVRLPVVRAVVLIVVACLGSLLTRRSIGFNTLAFAAIIVLAINPSDLFRVGPQLSFLAVSTILVFAPRSFHRKPLDQLLEEYEQTRPTLAMAGITVMQRAGQLFLVGLVIWIVASPLVMARFHLVSPVGVLVSFVALPLMMLALNFGFATMLFDAICPPLANFFGWLCDGSLGQLESVVQWGQSVPYGHWWVPGPASWWLVGFYGGLALYVARPAWRPSLRWRIALVLGWIALGTGVALASSPMFSHQRSQTLRCTFLSVGHGSAVVIETPDGQTLLYDAGSLSSPSGASRRISSYLWNRGITHIDAAILSHADTDHFNAVPRLLDKFGVGAVYVSPVMFYDPSRTLIALQESLDEHNIPVKEVYAGDQLSVGKDLKIEILHPHRRGAIGEDNANSIVLLIEYAGKRILLPGDLEKGGMADVIAEQGLPCDVIAAPHHGSVRSGPEDFVAWSTPRHVVISGGRLSHSHTAADVYQQAGARVLHTADNGAVTIEITPEGMKVDSFFE